LRPRHRWDDAHYGCSAVCSVVLYFVLLWVLFDSQFLANLICVFV